MKKWIVIIILLIAVIIGYNYLYQDHRDIASEAANYTVSSQNLKSEFETSPIQAEQKYLNKTIEVSGIVSEFNLNDLTLNDNIFCILKNPKQELKVGTSIKVKGRIIGYDDLLEQIKLDQCTIINNL
ncbi:hypothetical protein GSB9_01249 [Flavobacteriaceae bacterium GSB9]|nr:hypothetical protein GSB9_01249 [Flavobacteriaceae bacterium GSB9]